MLLAKFRISLIASRRFENWVLFWPGQMRFGFFKFNSTFNFLVQRIIKKENRKINSEDITTDIFDTFQSMSYSLEVLGIFSTLFHVLTPSTPSNL